MERKEITLHGEKCTNWKFIDSFGVRLDDGDSFYPPDGYENFYDEYTGKEL